MFKPKVFYALLAAGFLAFGSAAHAAGYDFGRPSKGTSLGYVAPNNFMLNPFAHLEATDTGSGVWSFTLNIANNLFSSFGSNAFIQGITFDFNPDPSPMPKSIFVSSNVGGTTAAWSYVGSGTSSMADVDFGTGFGKNAATRLTDSDYVTWNVTGLGASSLVNMFVRVKGIDGGYEANYMPVTVGAVPEPETYAMVLAGLGLLGFTARRRRNNA